MTIISFSGKVYHTESANRRRKGRCTKNVYRPRKGSASVLVVAAAHQRTDHAADKAGGDACSRGGQPAGQDADGSLFGKGGAHAFGKQMPEAQQGNGGTAACKLGQRRVPPKGREHHARHHIACQDAGGGQGGQVEKELAHHADGPACSECPEIVHVFPPFYSSGAASSTR